MGPPVLSPMGTTTPQLSKSSRTRSKRQSTIPYHQPSLSTGINLSSSNIPLFDSCLMTASSTLLSRSKSLQATTNSDSLHKQSPPPGFESIQLPPRTSQSTSTSSASSTMPSSSATTSTSSPCHHHPQSSPMENNTPRKILKSSPYDYFDWSRVQTKCKDPTTTAPVGALHDQYIPNPTTPNAISTGAWYAFAHGLDSHLGAIVFADHAHCAPRTTSPGRRGRSTLSHSVADSRDGAALVGHYRQTQHIPSDDDDESLSDCDSDDSDLSYTSQEDNNETSSPSFSYNKSSLLSWGTSLQKYASNPLVANRLVADRMPSPDIQIPPTDDITAEHAANGVDVQGIPWNTYDVSREDYRQQRLRTTSYSEDGERPESIRNAVKEPRRGAQFYDFVWNTRRVRCSILHFQLRNLAWATSQRDVFVIYGTSVVHWDAITKKKTVVLDLSGNGNPVAEGLSHVQISTMIAKDNLVIAGGFYGELVAKNVKNGAILHNQRITYDDNAITNAIDMFDNTVMTSNNDRYVRCFDANTFARKSQFAFDKPVNHATRQPNGKMVAVAADNMTIQVIDGENGDKISELSGHEEFSFATAWHPNSQIFATGSQDRTCRLWDVRNMRESFGVLGAHYAAVRSLRFSSCGRFLVMAEGRDFVHIFDVNRGQFDVCQEIDIFGNIAGIALTPGAEALYIAINDRIYSSLMEYERRNSSLWKDMIF